MEDTGAEDRELFDLEELSDHRFVYGIRGDREGQFAAIWFWENREAWDSLWGPIDEPVPPEEYPQTWKIWETEILDPLLPGDSDKIRYTSHRPLDLWKLVVSPDTSVAQWTIPPPAGSAPAVTKPKARRSYD